MPGVVLPLLSLGFCLFVEPRICLDLKSVSTGPYERPDRMLTALPDIVRKGPDILGVVGGLVRDGFEQLWRWTLDRAASSVLLMSCLAKGQRTPDSSSSIIHQGADTGREKIPCW